MLYGFSDYERQILQSYHSINTFLNFKLKLSADAIIFNLKDSGTGAATTSPTVLLKLLLLLLLLLLSQL
jgi:hypothetical protein